MDQSLRAIIRMRQRLAQRCSINVGSFVLSFVPSFIYSLSHLLIHLFTHSVQGVRDTSTILTSGGFSCGESLFCWRTLASSSVQVPSLGPSGAWAGVEEVMEREQAPEQSTQREPPDTGGIHGQAAEGTAEAQQCA